MLSDVDDDLGFDERFDDGGQNGRDELQSRGSHAAGGDEDAGVEITFVDVVRELSHLFDPDGHLFVELDPDRPNVRRRWVRKPRLDGDAVLVDHPLGRTGREGHALASGCCVLGLVNVE